MDNMAGVCIRRNGSTGTLAQTGTLADVNLADDTFHRQFSDSIPLTPEAQNLPDMQGSGLLRDLREAASQSGTLGLSRKSINKVGRTVAL